MLPPPSSYRRTVQNDLSAAVVVFLVAVPLCLGIALASGAPLFAGIISGIVGGLIVGAVSGSPLGVSGPAAGLAVVVLTSVQSLGSYEAFLVAVVLAGLMQIALGLARAGAITLYFPSSVIRGMLAAIGLIIILKQITHALGYVPAADDGLLTWTEKLSPATTGIAVLSILILVLWDRPAIKSRAISRLVQGPLLVVLAGIGLSRLLAGGSAYVLRDEQLVAIPHAQNFTEFLAQFQHPDLSALGHPQVYVIALTLAIIASLETLLCVDATDKLDPLKRATPPNRELVAQGIGNVVSGALGGLPVTQVIVRSSANIQAGGRTKLATIVHGALLLICVMAIPGVLNRVPLASLAAILIVVGFKLAHPSLFADMYRRGWHQFVPFLTTIVAILAADLLSGIALGLLTAAAASIARTRLASGALRWQALKATGTDAWKVAPYIHFYHKAQFQRLFDSVQAGNPVSLDVTACQIMDPDIRDLVDAFELHAPSEGKQLIIRGMTESIFT